MDEDDADFSELRKACMRGDVDTVDRILDQAGAEKNRMICDSTNDVSYCCLLSLSLSEDTLER